MGALYAIGHSTRSAQEFLDLLTSNGVQAVADLRRIPESRHNPQFGRVALEASLQSAGLRYFHLPRLTGLRTGRKADLTNAGWRNASFRAFADYMQTEEFERGLQELLELSSQMSVAMMCAEAVPWRCHRSLVADALVARGQSVLQITGKGKPTPHRLTPFARLVEGRVTYPPTDISASS